jgi:hypothetical protein
MALAPVVSRSTTANDNGAPSHSPRQSCEWGSPSSAMPLTEEGASAAGVEVCRAMIAARPEGAIPSTSWWRDDDHTFGAMLDVMVA